MKLLKLVGYGVLLAATYGSAQAGSRHISTDGWEYDGPGTGTSVTITPSTVLPDLSSLPTDLISMTFAPGSTASSYIINSSSPGDGYVWGGAEQVELFSTSTMLTVDFNYGESSCSGETASLTVNGSSYSASNACNLGKEYTGTDSSGTYDYFQSQFVFTDSAGTLTLTSGTPSGWCSGSSCEANAAPEIDPSSAVTGFTLLVGGIAVFTGRRRSMLRPKSGDAG